MEGYLLFDEIQVSWEKKRERESKRGKGEGGGEEEHHRG